MLPLVALVVLWQGIGWVRAPALPDEAPPFRLRGPDGDVVALSDHRGRTVVLNFWATWCGPCMVEAPSFAAFAKANPDVTVIGMTADDDPAKVRKTAKDLGLDYPLAMADRETLAAYGVSTFPTTVIIGPDGTIRTAHTGILFRPQIWLLTQLTGG
ncbi:MAG: TlpA family protein disulfide reductase [Alphaproteobacteria bacterium]|nr:TlpA family protein disulfide reductase [Alphaproteobacteria bacterium]